MRPSIDHLRSTLLVRRYNVVALAFVLCAWLIATAMHLHLTEKHKEVGGAHPQACSYCLAFSGGAAPPPEHRVPLVLSRPVVIAISYELPAPAQGTATFYLSRGPPAI